MAQRETRRLTITVSKITASWLEREADKRAISTAELMRRILDDMRGEGVIRTRPEGGGNIHHG